MGDTLYVGLLSKVYEDGGISSTHTTEVNLYKWMVIVMGHCG